MPGPFFCSNIRLSLKDTRYILLNTGIIWTTDINCMPNACDEKGNTCD